MLVGELELIHGLERRNADGRRARDGHGHPTRRVGPVTRKDLEMAERALGFPLPELLRAMYRKVGNGGFGPGYGILGTRGGYTLDGCSLESCYQGMFCFEQENAAWHWPERLVPLANYGCGMWSCVDCQYKRLPMILWDPNNLDSELEGADARLNWGNAFWSQGRSLRTWLQDWLAVKPEREPTWPSDAWMKRRLGFTLPR